MKNWIWKGEKGLEWGKVRERRTCQESVTLIQATDGGSVSGGREKWPLQRKKQQHLTTGWEPGWKMMSGQGGGGVIY